MPVRLLPGACAILDLSLADQAGARIVAANDAFKGLCAGGLDGRTHAGIVRAVMDMPRRHSPTVTHEFVWEEPGPTGRSFDVSLRTLNDGRVLLALNDLTRQRRSEAALRREALSDDLTGLPNRAALIEAMAAPRVADGGHMLLLVDLARFSRINESLGPLAADELLLAVANRLRRALRQSDVLARIGGNEFALLLQVDGEDAATLAGRMRALFDDPFRIGDLRISIDAAVGGLARLTPQDGTGPEDWLRFAQIGLKTTKQAGLAPAFYARGEQSEARARLDCESALRSALERREIVCAYQPLVDLPSRRIVGFEALARWTRDGRAVPPGEFVAVAEDCGLIVELGRQVLHDVLATLGRWDAAAGGRVDTRVAVNVSPLQLLRDDLPAAVDAAAEATGVAPDRLIVEITESAVVTDPDRAAEVFRALALRGIGVAMDDFGTGYSNIASLARLPIDTLKIDRSLIRDVDTRDEARAIVRTIQHLASALGMRTTAEGIESEGVAREIAQLGCNQGQGYLFARPLSAHDAYRAVAA